ncbi:MAG: pentapeptide repeat-containing protein [Leptolyngbyaceae cyanobacterium]
MVLPPLSFINQDLRRRSFRLETLQNAHFVDCDLRGCDFYQADLRGATFYGVARGIWPSAGRSRAWC